jgi:hypothetical protein
MRDDIRRIGKLQATCGDERMGAIVDDSADLVKSSPRERTKKKIGTCIHQNNTPNIAGRHHSPKLIHNRPR